MLYERFLASVAATPWAIEVNKGRELLAILNRRAAGHRATPDELAAAAEIRAERQRRGAKPRPRAVALVPLHGVMMQRADLFSEVSGLLSTEQVGRLVDQAAADPSVEAIVLDVDSPGGSVFGTAELAAKVAAAAKQKKVIAVADSTAFSAAYYVASQASEFVVTLSGMVGSVGTLMVHVDESEKLKMAGEVVTVVASSELKAAGMDPGPLSAALRQEFEGIVAGYYDQFVRAVAAGRGVSQKKVREEFGQGGVLLADAAVRVGMADKVASLDDVLARYGLSAADLTPPGAMSSAEGPGNPRGSRAAQSPPPELQTRRRRLLLD